MCKAPTTCFFVRLLFPLVRYSWTADGFAGPVVGREGNFALRNQYTRSATSYDRRNV